MIGKALGLLMLASGIALIACSSSDDSEKYPSVDSFCTAKATAECNAPSVATCGVTSAACQTARKAACNTAAAAATGQGRVYTPSNVEACLTATDTAYRNPTVAADLTARDDACNRVFSGTKGKSVACTSEYDCQGTLVCDLSKNPNGGNCADKVAKGLNDPCTDPGDICATGTYCSGSGTAFFCAADRNIGEACTPTLPCDSTKAFCNSPTSGTCTALGNTGDACTSDTNCATTFCNANSKCAARQFPSEKGVCADFGG